MFVLTCTISSFIILLDIIKLKSSKSVRVNALRLEIYSFCDSQATDQAMELLFSQEKQMEVCQICGAFLIVNDSQSRVDDHLMGKQHMGYARIKATLEEMQVC